MNYSQAHIWRVAGPILFSLLMSQMIGMTDTAFLGRLGEIELGAAALGSVYFLALYMIGFGFSIGAQVLISRRNGEQHYRDIGKVFYNSLTVLTLCGIGLTAVSLLLSGRLLSSLIHSTTVYAATQTYLDYRVLGLVFAFAGTMFRAFYVGITSTRVLTLNAAVMVLTNVVLNYLLIFGKCGFPQWGIMGAAVASTLAEASSVVFYIIYTRKKIDLRKYSLHRLQFLDPDVLRRVFDVSLWTMLQSFFAVSVWFIFFIAVERNGERDLASVNLLRSISAFPYIILNAFATAASTLVGNLVGEGKTAKVLPLSWQITRAGLLATVPVLALIALFPYATLRVYTDNEALIASTIPALYVMIAGSLLQIPANIWFNVVSGTGNTRTALWIELLTLFLYLISVWIIVIRMQCHVAGAWSTEILYQVIMLGLVMHYMYRGKWKNRRI